jgi:hypothetical protein
MRDILFLTLFSLSLGLIACKEERKEEYVDYKENKRQEKVDSLRHRAGKED